MTFLQAYKKIDIFIKDAYNCNNGVSTYLANLDELEFSNWYGIEWKFVYDKLKKYRHIRNQIAHDDIEENILYSEYDIEWLNEFYNKLLNRTDPLSLRRKAINQHNLQNSTARKNNTSKEKLSLGIRIKNFFKNIFKKN